MLREPLHVLQVARSCRGRSLSSISLRLLPLKKPRNPRLPMSVSVVDVAPLLAPLIGVSAGMWPLFAVATARATVRVAPRSYDRSSNHHRSDEQRYYRGPTGGSQSGIEGRSLSRSRLPLSLLQLKTAPTTSRIPSHVTKPFAEIIAVAPELEL